MIDVIFISLLCTGVFILFNGEGMIFSELANYIRSKVKEVYLKPFFGCLPCMSSFWTIAYVSSFGNLFQLETLFIMVATCGLNYLIGIKISE